MEVSTLFSMLPDVVRYDDKISIFNVLVLYADISCYGKHIIENEMLNGDVIRLDGAIRMAPQ